VFLLITDAPFSNKEKKAVLRLGVTGADWGHPRVVLPNPVAYFKKQIRDTEKLLGPTGNDVTPQELGESPPPFEP